MEIKENFEYVVNINQWAIIEFFKTKNIKLERLKELKGEHFIILSFIVEKYLNNNLINKVFKEQKYTWMGNGFFYDNLPVMFVKVAKTEGAKKKEYEALKRNLQNYLKRLIELGFIYRITENETTRFLRVDPVLLSKCNKGELKISPLDLINKYAKKDLQAIQKEYELLLPYKRYYALEKSFFHNEHYDQYMFKKYDFDKQDIFNRFRLYLDECVNDPYYKKKAPK